jgi:hypothetical protein
MSGLLGPPLLLCALGIAWWFSGTPRGALAAHFDVWRGHYEYRSVGLNLFSTEESALLLNRYGIRERVLALCIVSKPKWDYAGAYNQIAVAAVEKKIGRDVIGECSGEARRNGFRDLALRRVGEAAVRLR